MPWSDFTFDLLELLDALLGQEELLVLALEDELVDLLGRVVEGQQLADFGAVGGVEVLAVGGAEARRVDELLLW